MTSVVQSIVNIWSLIKQEYGRFTAMISVVALLSFISGLLEGIAINSVIPLFAFVNGTSTKGTDMISYFIESIFSTLHITYTLKYLLIFIAVLFLLKAIVLYSATWIAARLNTKYERDTRLELFGGTLLARWPFIIGQKIGHLEQVLTIDVNNSSNLLSYLTSGLLILANLLVYFFVSFNISPPIALLSLALGLLVFLVFKPFFSRNRQTSSRVEKLYKELAHFVNQHMLGMKTVKSLAVEAAVTKRGQEFFDEVRESNLRVTAVRNLTNTLLQPIGLLFILGIFSYFYKLTNFDFASFAVIVYAINKIFTYVQQGQAQMHGISSLSPYVSSIQHYRKIINAEREPTGGVKPFVFRQQLNFERVNFSYTATATVATLQDLSFSIKRGELVGLVGPSGAGKTTIVDLLLGLYLPTSGRITVDGVSLQEFRLTDWRNRVGYVSQEMFLLNDTIENNIRFYHSNVSDHDIQEATKLANISTFIDHLPNQYKTIVGERGLLLSGGERQRIILARVLARHPDLLILDEATSALDNESEALIQKAIEELRSKITVIVIAHRLSTVMNANRLLIIENGKLTAEGSPDEMLKDKRSYLYKVMNINTP